MTVPFVCWQDELMKTEKSKKVRKKISDEEDDVKMMLSATCVMTRHTALEVTDIPTSSSS